ncbi:MAG: DUF1178 family protein [Cucumibacter sp.]
MIQYALVCENDHHFEGWFRNADGYEQQSARRALECPICTSSDIHKALMAPSVSRANSEKVSLSTGHPEQAEIRQAMRRLRNKLTSETEYVGDRFADEARKIHFREVASRGIYGEATPEEVGGLIEDGIDFMPLPNLPEEHN